MNNYSSFKNKVLGLIFKSRLLRLQHCNVMIFEKTGNVHRRTFSPALALALALASGSANGSGGTGIAGNANYPQPARCPCVKDARNTFPLLPGSQGTAKFDGSGAPDNLGTKRTLSWRKT